MLKLIPQYKQGNKSPDHDPAHLPIKLQGGTIPGYKLSSAIMRMARKSVDKKAAETTDTPDNGAPQSTFLMNRKNLQKVFENEGYTKVDNNDYGPVSNAVNISSHKNVPIYQKYPDTNVDKNNLQKIGTFMDYAINNANTKTNIYNGPVDSYLTDPANFPVDVYIDRKTGKVYNQGWDFNDYHNIRNTTGISKLKNIAGNILDRIGNPTVVTTGLQRNNIKPMVADEYLQSNNPMLSYQLNDATGEYEIRMKPVVITAKGNNKEEKVYRPASELSADEFWEMMEANKHQQGGQLKLIPKAQTGIQFPFYSNRVKKAALNIINKQVSNQLRNQVLGINTDSRLNPNSPILKSDTRSTTQRQRDYNRAVQLEVKQKANELAASFGRALGANHNMTVDEVNENTLNTANLMGYMTAPYLMTALESGYYYGVTERPKEAVMTAGVGYGLPILFKGIQQLPNAARSYVVSRELKRGIKQATKLDETIGVPGQIGWAPKQTFTGYHASNEKTFDPNFWYENWARTTHNAPYGIYIAEGTAPTKGFLAKRPYVHNVTVELERPMVQLGELLTNTKNSTRNELERFAQKQGADAIIFQDIKDNQMNHQNILKTLNPDTKLIINN